MTRLLIPEMFGIAAIAAMVPIILALLSDIGLGQNIVQSRRGEDPTFLNTAWSVQIIRGFLLWAVAILLSAALYMANLGGYVPANSVYASPALPLVIAVTSFSACISGFASTRLFTALRVLDQKRSIQVELAGQVAGLAVMITLGVITRSIWSLVASVLVSSFTTTVLSHVWMSGHPNRIQWDRDALHELLHFGKWIFVSSAVYVLAVNGDRIILGGLVDAHMLGLYAIAAMMVGAVEAGLSKLVSSVSLPAFSEIVRKEPDRLREVYYRLRVPCDLVLLFMAGFLFATGHLIVEMLYDPRYLSAGHMLQVLATSLVIARYGVAHKLYIAMGLPRYEALINSVRLLGLLTCVPLSYYFAGLQGTMWAIALHALPTVFVVFWINAKFDLNDFRREMIVLVALPSGWLCGYTLSQLR